MSIMRSILFGVVLFLSFFYIQNKPVVTSIELKSGDVRFINGNNLDEAKLELVESGKNFTNSLKHILRNGNENKNLTANLSKHINKKNENSNVNGKSSYVDNDNGNVTNNGNIAQKKSIDTSIETGTVDDATNMNAEADQFFKENDELIRDQVISDLNEKFLIEVTNASTLNFLDGLHNGDDVKSDVNYQIELEESCSPFFCEKEMKAKEVSVSVKDNGNDNNSNRDSNYDSDTDHVSSLKKDTDTSKSEKSSDTDGVDNYMNANRSNESKNINALYKHLVENNTNINTEKGIKPHAVNNDTDLKNENNSFRSETNVNEDKNSNNIDDEEKFKGEYLSENCEMDNESKNPKVETIFQEIFADKDGDLKQREKIVVTDGNTIYVLEEIIENENAAKDDTDLDKLNLNNGVEEKEINVHVPADKNESDSYIIISDLDLLNALEADNLEENEFSQKESADKEIKEHTLSNLDTINDNTKNDDISTSVNTNAKNMKETTVMDGMDEQMKVFGNDDNVDEKKVEDDTDRNENEKTGNAETDNVEERIFNMNEEDLSKKIYEELKLNNEDKVECYNFSNDADKCSSYKKCTYVNIDNKDLCFLDYNFMLFLKNNNCALQSKSSLLSIAKDLLKNEIIDRQLFQLLRNSNNTNFLCDSITYSYLTNVVDNTEYDEVFE